MTSAERKLKKEFKQLLAKFSGVLLEKLLSNERKYRFGNSWKIPDWESHLHQDLIKHVKKGDPRDTAIYSLFAWFHGWRTAPIESTFICEGCKCECESSFSARTKNYCFLCDPAITLDELLSDEPLLTVGQIEAITVRNLELIGAFLDHVKLETEIEIPEEVVISFLNG